MEAPLVRPPIAELVFRLYDRPLHPELFDALAVRRVERDGYQVEVRITRTGHLLSWTRGAVHVVELTTTAGHGLPAAGCRLDHRVAAGERTGRCEVGPGVRYQVSSQVEVLPPELFVHVHEEVVADGIRKGLLFHFRPENRLGLSPVGVVIVEALPACLSVSAFHTFPDELAVVKTQSIIERV
jgi:hypothetical protein